MWTVLDYYDHFGQNFCNDPKQSKISQNSPKPMFFFKSTFFRHPVNTLPRARDQKVSGLSENMKWFPRDGCAMNNEARAICISRVREPQQHFVWVTIVLNLN